MKKTLSIFLSLLLLMSFSTLFSAIAKTEVKEKTLGAYTSKTYKLKKSASKKYLYKVKYNEKKYIYTNFKDNGSTYTLSVKAKNVTDGKKPVIKVYYRNAAKEVVPVKVLRYTVTPAKTLEFKDAKINVDTSDKITLENPFYREYKLKTSDGEIVKLPTKCKKDGTDRIYSFKALKEGTATIKVYIKGTKIAVGSFEITAGDFETSILPEFKTVKLKYNSHGSSTYMADSHCDVADMLVFKHADGEYYTMVDDEKVVHNVDDTVIYSTGTGKTKVTVYEKRNKKKITVGKIEFKSVNASTAYVVKQNALFYDNNIFGYGDNTEFLNLTDSKTISLKPVIKERLLNNEFTGSKIPAADYKISFTSTNTKVAKVSIGGKVTAVKAGSAKIKFTISFADKSEFNYSCKIIVE